MNDLKQLAEAAYLAGLLHEVGGVCFDEYWQRHRNKWMALLKGAYDSGFCLGSFWNTEATLMTAEQQAANNKGWEAFSK